MPQQLDAREGHNLQFADEIIFFALPWSPPDIQQWIGRIDRLGTRGVPSSRTIAITPIVTENSIEARILEVLEATKVFERSEVWDDSEWEAVFRKFHETLRPGGSLWIADLVRHTIPEVQQQMWRRYGEYLVALKGPEYRDHVYAYVEFEDTPQTLAFQLDLLRKVGFREVEVLHKHNCFAAFCARK